MDTSHIFSKLFSSFNMQIPYCSGALRALYAVLRHATQGASALRKRGSRRAAVRIWGAELSNVSASGKLLIPLILDLFFMFSYSVILEKPVLEVQPYRCSTAVQYQWARRTGPLCFLIFESQGGISQNLSPLAR